MHGRRTTTPTHTTSAKTTSSTLRTDLDDWETDPDFVGNFDEMQQRWGNNRTVGSINMNELIDDVRREHQKIRDKFSESFKDFGHHHHQHEKISKHVVQETRKEVISSSKENVGSAGGEDFKDVKRTIIKEDIVRDSSAKPTSVKMPPVAPKPDFGRQDFTSRLLTSSSNREPSSRVSDDEFRHIDDSGKPNIATSTKWRSESTSPKAGESSSFKRYFNEEKKTSSTSSLGHKSADFPSSFKSIQDKIDAFKKEFEDIENNVSHQNRESDISKVFKKSSNVERKVVSSESNSVHGSSPARQQEASYSSPLQSKSTRPASSSPLGRNQANQREGGDFLPKSSSNIKSLSEKFETLCREDEDDFRRRTEAKRKEFFDQIKHQVRETRKGLDGFDPIDDDVDDQYDRQYAASRLNTSASPSKSPIVNAAAASKSPPSSYLSSSSVGKPKVYTRSETTKEEIVSRVVKENDKIVQNETKRNVERKSSCHGSSDEETGLSGEPTSIKHLTEKMRSSPQHRAASPIDELKRKVPVVEPEVKGGGLMARALFDYTAAEDDELTFDVDDLITNIEKVDPGWYKGTMTIGGHKRVGLFPANHVKLLNDDGEY